MPGRHRVCAKSACLRLAPERCASCPTVFEPHPRREVFCNGVASRDSVCQGAIGRDQLNPPTSPVQGSMPGEVRGEILDVRLRARPVLGEPSRGRPRSSITSRVWSASANSRASITVASFCPGLSVTSSNRGGSQTSTRPMPSQPL